MAAQPAPSAVGTLAAGAGGASVAAGVDEDLSDGSDDDIASYVLPEEEARQRCVYCSEARCHSAPLRCSGQYAEIVVLQ